MSYSSILGAAEKAGSLYVGGALSEYEQRIHDEIVASGAEATQAYSTIKNAVLSNVKVDMQQGISIQWESMAKDIAGGAVQLGIGAIGSLAGGSTKFMGEVSSAAMSIFSGAIAAASTGDWGKFALDTVLEIVNLIDDIIQEVLLQLIEQITDIMADTMAGMAESVPLIGAIIGAVIGVVRLFVAMEDGRKQVLDKVEKSVPQMCEQFYTAKVVPSGQSQVAADLFIQVAAGPCVPGLLDLGATQCRTGGAEMCPIIARPASAVARFTAWGPYCAAHLKDKSVATLNVGGPEAAKYGLTYASLLKDMVTYQYDWYRFGRGRLTRVPDIGKVLMVATEHNDALDYSRRAFYRSMRMAIQRTFWAGGDGGATLLPIYIDALKADRYSGNCSDAQLSRLMNSHFRVDVKAADTTSYACSDFAKWAGVEGIAQLVANWSRDTENPMYAADKMATEEMKVAIQSAKHALAIKNKGVVIANPTVMKRLVGVATQKHGSVLPVATILGGLSLMFLAARSVPRKRSFSFGGG